MKTIVSVLVLFFCCVAQTYSYQFEFITLNSLEPDASSYAWGINNSHDIVGVTYDSSNQQQAFLWSEQNGMSYLGALPGSCAQSIANNGDIAGYITDAYGQKHATLWSQGSVYDVGVLQGHSESIAYDINDASDIVGVCPPDSAIYAEAIIYKNSELYYLEGLYELNSHYLYAINNDSVSVGTAHGIGAFSYANGQVSTLNLGSDSIAYDINDAGTVVAVDGNYVYLYHNGVNTIISDYFRPFRMNIKTEIVGSLDDRAILWADGITYDLNDLVNTQGWFLESATDITDDGYIIGYAYKDNQYNAFLLKPVSVPEPSPIALLISGDIAIVLWKLMAKIRGSQS